MSAAYDNVSARYQRIRRENEQICLRRREDAYKKAPEIRELEDRLLELNLARLKGAITADDATNPEKIREEIREVEKKITKVLTEIGFDAHFLDPVYTCEKCQDTGYITPVDKCGCYCRYLLEERVKESGMKRNSGTFETFDVNVFRGDKIGGTASQRQYMTALKKEAETFSEQIGSGDILVLILMGGSGTGKTFLAESILNRALKNGAIGQYVTANQLFSAFHHHRLGDAVDIDLYNEIPVLVIDDLGTEIMTRNVTEAYFYNLINERMVRANTTVIASNLDPAMIKARYGDRTYSRLFSKQSQKHLIPAEYADVRKQK